jgi:ketosteroid isomerase-like protein
MPEPSIEDLEAALRRAMLSGDVDALDALLADALVFTTRTGAIATKQADLEAHRSGSLQLTVLDPSEERIQRFGDTAIVSVKMRVAGRYVGTAFDGVYRYLRVWIRSLERPMADRRRAGDRGGGVGGRRVGLESATSRRPVLEPSSKRHADDGPTVE